MPYRLESNKPKGRCPSCSAPKTFRYFEDTRTGQRLPVRFGRCDRENSCRYFERPPAHFEMHEPEYQIVDPKDFHCSMKRAIDNPFFHYLRDRFGHERALERVQSYGVGTGRDAKTIFWYRDELGHVRNAKLYRYGAHGRRDKTYPPHYRFKRDQGFTIPLFGAHLIPSAQDQGIRKIAGVESEKTALIASIRFPNALWLASGGAHMLTEERCESLHQASVRLGRAPIHLFADADEAGRKGFLKAAAMLRQLGSPVVYHDLFPDRHDGRDVADEISDFSLMSDRIRHSEALD